MNSLDRNRVGDSQSNPPVGPAVWVVEDNRMLRDDLTALINERQDMHCPVSAESCEEALAALDEGLLPDIVLMDIGLPGINGIEGASRIRSLSPSSRVIMLTIHEEDDKVFEAICAGASGYLLKPSPPDQIVTAILDVQRGSAPINGYIARKMLEMFSRLGTPLVPHQDYGLTKRQKEILQLLVDGMTMKQIAGRLYLSFHTIDNHIRNIYDKLHVHSRSSAVAKALRERLI